ncbi:hypothetical protein [Paraburkholderia sp. J76]|uniref:hypothetical protein n=1 Tax=Paraburkholderia sp. J76 TaxID=2805439 RepID=UPI002ABE78E0|nr:hypothetical protein [Paraburkholderia sp. J76]
MSWPIPVFLKIEYPKPISLRVWLPSLVAIASCAVTAVVLVWPHGKPTDAYPFWSALIGAPLGACMLTFGVRWCLWRREQTDAEVAEGEQLRLRDLWRRWTRRHLRVVDIATFPAATNEITRFASEKIDLPTSTDRNIGFEWAKGRSAVFRRIRLLRLVAMRFAEVLQNQRDVIVTLMLDDESLKQTDVWNRRAMRMLGCMAPGVKFRVETQAATNGARWITQLADRIDPATRLVIAAQLWADGEEEHKFSEGAAAFLIVPDASKAGAIWRPMISDRDTLETGLSQIKKIQTSPSQLTDVWSAGCEYSDSSALRSILKKNPKDPVSEHLLDEFLGNPGPASGWIAMAIAMEAMRGAGPQLVAWREPNSESLYLCAISPVPQKETTV